MSNPTPTPNACRRCGFPFTDDDPATECGECNRPTLCTPCAEDHACCRLEMNADSNKSIRDRVRECISMGLDAQATADKVAGEISMGRLSKGRLMSLHEELSPGTKTTRVDGENSK